LILQAQKDMASTAIRISATFARVLVAPAMINSVCPLKVIQVTDMFRGHTLNCWAEQLTIARQPHFVVRFVKTISIIAVVARKPILLAMAASHYPGISVSILSISICLCGE
jgi:hypothetical protein